MFQVQVSLNPSNWMKCPINAFFKNYIKTTILLNYFANNSESSIFIACLKRIIMYKFNVQCTINDKSREKSIVLLIIFY